MTLDELLRSALQKGATDIHLKAGVMPVIRRHGALRPLSSNIPPMTSEEIEKLAAEVLNPKQKAHFDLHREIDLGYGVSGLGRFRISIFRQRGTIRMVIRNVPFKVPSFEELNLPPVLQKIALNERGLILVTGTAGSGKSSTLAALIDDINKRENKHILTIEDPIEYLIRDKKSLITQREIGLDSDNFTTALRAGLRQDPDVIFIGEMRDRETVEAALLAAETGHLVLSTLHTLNATETVNRILSSFEASHQSQIRMQLGATLKAVVSQRLVRRKDGEGLVPALEVLLNTQRVRELIEDPKLTPDIQLSIEEGGAAYGMQSFDQSLMELLNRDLITFDEALLHCSRPEDFRIRYDGIHAMDGKKWSETGVFGKKVDDKWQNVTEVEIDLPITQIKKLRKKSGGDRS